MIDSASRLEQWSRLGTVLEVDGRELFFVDEGPRKAPTLLLLHGFPSCSYDFHRALPLLARRHRVIVHDHPGFGLSEKHPRDGYSLLDQARFAAALWRRLGVRSGHLVAHDYGTSVATELLARRETGELEVDLDSVTLSNGSVYLELARLLRTQRLLRHPLGGPIFARLTSRRFFKERMRRLWGDRSRVDEGELDLLWSALIRAGGRAVLPKIARYLDERVRYRERWIGALQRLDLPTLILWGRLDPIAVGAIATRLGHEIPRAEIIWLEGVGHYPMLEEPEAWSERLLQFVGGADSSSGQSPDTSR